MVCATCSGSGLVLMPFYTPGHLYEALTKCLSCNGTGKVSGPPSCIGGPVNCGPAISEEG